MVWNVTATWLTTTRYSLCELTLQPCCNRESERMKILANELGEDRSIFKCCCVEQTDESEATETENRSVGGSIPPLGTSNSTCQMSVGRFQISRHMMRYGTR